MKSAAAILLWATASIFAQPPYRPEIPKTWDASALASLEVPHPDPRYSPVAVPVEYYYRVPVRPVYKTYPVYAPGREPAHYVEWLREQEPQVTFDPARLRSEDDWIKAGELVFDAPFGFDFVIALADVRNAAWFEHVKPPVTKTGVVPFAAYVIREKGKIELGTFACAMCHTRVLPDGTIVKGAQGNFPIDRANAFGFRHAPVQVVRNIYRTLSGAPWSSRPGEYAFIGRTRRAVRRSPCRSRCPPPVEPQLPGRDSRSDWPQEPALPRSNRPRTTSWYWGSDAVCRAQ
jgi:hypothetical protein